MTQSDQSEPKSDSSRITMECVDQNALKIVVETIVIIYSTNLCANYDSQNEDI